MASGIAIVTNERTVMKSPIMQDAMHWRSRHFGWLANNREKMILWAKALRSGNYEQCQSTLHKEFDSRFDSEDDTDDKFCCLGVFANEFIPGKWELNVLRTTSGRTVSGNLHTTHLPNDRFFITLNDTYKLTFKEIAEVIDYILD